MGQEENMISASPQIYFYDENLNLVLTTSISYKRVTLSNTQSNWLAAVQIINQVAHASLYEVRYINDQIPKEYKRSSFPPRMVDKEAFLQRAIVAASKALRQE